MSEDLGTDIPHLRLTPGGWLATGLDSPRIGIVGRERTEALELFRTERAKWRKLMSLPVSYGPCGLGWPVDAP